jgi:hypothetical protein
VPRLPIAIVLVVALLVAVLVGNGDSATPQQPATADQPVAIPPQGARSVAWYCAGGPVSLRETDDAGEQLAAGPEVLRIGNLGERAQPLRLTVMAEGEIVARAAREVPPMSTLAVPVRELSNAAEPGVVVETFSNEVVVEHTVGASGVATGPCATEPGAQWFLPVGTTVAGAQQWLTLFNPFGDDATVDVIFDTSNGRREPEQLTGLTVPRRSRLSVPVHDFVFREERVSTTLRARSGRIVAEQSLEIVEGGTGTSLSLGAVAAAPTWVLPGGRAAPGTARRLVVMNPGDVDVDVDVRALTNDGTIVEPQAVHVRRLSATDLDVTALVPSGVTAAFVVDTGSARGVVVGDSLAYDDVEIDDVAVSDIATTLGVSRPAESWAFATSRLGDAPAARMLVANPGLEPVTIDVQVLRAGDTQAPERGRQVEVAPGRTVVVVVRRSGADAAVTVTGSGDVAVSRLAADEDRGLTIEPGVPARS